MAGPSQKETRELLEHLAAQGARIQPTKSGARVLHPTNGETMSLHWSSSDHRTTLKRRQDVKRLGYTWPSKSTKKQVKSSPEKEPVVANYPPHIYPDWQKDASKPPTREALDRALKALVEINSPTVLLKQVTDAENMSPTLASHALYYLGWRHTGEVIGMAKVWSKQEDMLGPMPEVNEVGASLAKAREVAAQQRKQEAESGVFSYSDDILNAPRPKDSIIAEIRGLIGLLKQEEFTVSELLERSDISRATAMRTLYWLGYRYTGDTNGGRGRRWKLDPEHDRVAREVLPQKVFIESKRIQEGAETGAEQAREAGQQAGDAVAERLRAIGEQIESGQPFTVKVDPVDPGKDVVTASVPSQPVEVIKHPTKPIATAMYSTDGEREIIDTFDSWVITPEDSDKWSKLRKFAERFDLDIEVRVWRKQ